MSDKKKFKIPFSRKWIKYIVIIVVIIVAVKYISSKVEQVQKISKVPISTATVEKQDIIKTLSASGTVEPLNKYNVTSLVQGEVIAASFKEGDKVKKGDVLYKISTENVETELESADISRQKAAMAYDQALEQLDDLTVYANATGYVKKVHVKTGDTIQAGTPIADVYDNSTMYLEVPFNASDVKSSWVGKRASIELEESFDSLKGTVTKVSSYEEALSGNMVVKMVTIKVSNPGGIAADSSATAKIGSIVCNSAGKFRVAEEKTINSTLSGKISSLRIKEGGTVKDGNAIIVMDSSKIKDSLESNKLAIKEADLARKMKEDSLDNYRVTAPISGQVITKNIKKGDTISMGTGEAKPLAVIYDLSGVTFKMNIDELDVRSIKKGQKVTVTADALEGVVMTGKVDNISLESIAQNGVTQYPVTVRLDEVGDLLPGMNVTGVIVTQEAKQVMAIPAEALIRGNMVYVKKNKDNAPVDTTTQDGKASTADGKNSTKDTKNDTKNEANSSAVDATNGQTAPPVDPTLPLEVQKDYTLVPVEIGLSDGIFIEIKSGLSLKDVIYVAAPSQMTDMFGNSMGGTVMMESSGGSDGE